MAKPRSSKKATTANVNTTEGPQNTGLESAASAIPVETASSEPVESVTAMKKVTVRRTMRKPEIVKSEPRSNLAPINVEDEIRRLAYLFSERRGFVPGHETEDWLNAEHEVLQRYQHHQTASA